MSPDTGLGLEEMKACPFCGAPGRTQYMGLAANRWAVGCSAPGCFVLSCDFITEPEARAAWNRRALTEEMKASVAGVPAHGADAPETDTPCDLDLDALEKVARAATPGPWQNGIEDLEGVVAPYNPGLGNVVCIPPTTRMYTSLEHWPSNAAHIATFDPPTVLKLIAAARSAALTEAPSPVSGGWRDIESAPRDGTAILGAWRTGPCGDGHYAISVMWWAGAWCEYNRKPTHWMPLPAPPAVMIEGSRASGADSASEGLRPFASDSSCQSEKRWRPEVVAFADLMEAKLRENDHKGGWKGEDPFWLLERVREETEEVYLAACEMTDGVTVGREAADVANFAMMIADVCGALPQPDHVSDDTATSTVAPSAEGGGA